MTNSNEINKSMQWYFHPVESVRMLRYFQFNIKFDSSIDYTPKYSNNPSLGVVINADKQIEYLDLHLHYLKNVNNINNILVYDNCSDKQNEIKTLCEQYNVEFYSPEQSKFESKEFGNISDIDVIYQGLLWAKQNNIEVLIKFNVDFIPCFTWTNSLLNLITESDSITFTTHIQNENYNINFLSDVIGLYVPVWTSQYALQCMLFAIQNEMTICPNIWFHELSKTMSGNNYSEKWYNYNKQNKTGYLFSGYANWFNILSTNKHEKTLCYMFNNEEEFFEKLNKTKVEKHG
jgi:hypothetical protein